jgi:hypothetical protein
MSQTKAQLIDGKSAEIEFTGGSASAPAISFTGDSNTGIYSPGADQVAVATNGTGRLFVDASGNVGVGTHVVGGGMFASSTTGGSIVQARNSDFSSLGYFGVEGSTGGVTLTGTLANSTFISSGASGTPLQFGTGGVIRSTLTSTGLGIGTSSPSSDGPLTLSNSATTPTIFFERESTNYNGAIQCSAYGTITFYNGADSSVVSGLTPRMTIDGQYGNVGIGTASPGSTLHLSAAQAEVKIQSTSGTNPGYLSFIPGGVSNPWYIYANSSRNLIFEDFATERMRIDASGRLLVGTSSSSQSAKLTVQGNANDNDEASLDLNRGTDPATNQNLALIRFTQVGSREGARISALRDGGVWGAASCPARLVFSTTANGASSPTERMRITSDGQTKVFSSSDFTFLAYSVKGANATTDRLFAGIHSATGVNDGTLSFQVWTNGNVQNTNNSYGAISDIKLKENIVDANSQWDDLKALQVRNYNFKPETNQQTHPQIGLVAQEVELVSPGLVSESPDRDEDGNDLGTVTKSVNYSVLYMKAVKALQEAMERIETLEGMVAVNNITIDEQQHQLSTLAARLTALESA